MAQGAFTGGAKVHGDRWREIWGRQQLMTRIVVMTTGGTISTRDVDGSGAKPVLRGEDLLQAIPGLDAVPDVEVAELAFVPGAFMTLAMIAQLSTRGQHILARPEVSG